METPIKKLNEDIRREAAEAGIFIWQIGQRWGCSEATFSRKLRREFTPEQKAKVRQIIADLVKEREEV